MATRRRAISIRQVEVAVVDHALVALRFDHFAEIDHALAVLREHVHHLDKLEFNAYRFFLALFSQSYVLQQVCKLLFGDKLFQHPW